MGALPASALTVVLVGPEQAANVGFVARTMACFHVNSLRIVGSPGIAGLEPARKTGRGAEMILEQARYFDALPQAVADCSFTFGFTRRDRDPSQTVLDLSEAVTLTADSARPAAVDSPLALVFGRESQGLFREETLGLSHLVRIAMADETLSLNVSHAAAIALHAFVNVDHAEAYNATSENQALTMAEKNFILKNLLQALEKKGFLKEGKAEAQKEYVHILWQRLNPNRRELDFLTGLLKALDGSREGKGL